MCSALAISHSCSSRRCRMPQQQLIIRASLKVKGLLPELLTTAAPAPGAISFISANDDHGFPSLQFGTSAQAKVYQVVLKQASMAATSLSSSSKIHGNNRGFFSPHLLDEAYRRCGEICADYAKTFYLGTLLMTPERRKAIWAIYVWCRRTDELVDGPNSCYITARALEAWERRLEDAFDGRPYDMLDAALSHTVAKFPLDIQPFRDMIEGMRTDLKKWRYMNFEELYLYCYYVAGTVGLMSVPVMGMDMGMGTTQLTTISLHHNHLHLHHVYSAALALGVANQLTNILRDVGEDARRGRIYLPQDELHEYGLTDQDILDGEVTGKWVMFMKAQIARARKYFDQAEKGISDLDKASRWPIWCSLILYRQILDAIEVNGYNNFTKRACVGKVKKIVTLPVAYMRSLFPQLLHPYS